MSSWNFSDTTTTSVGQIQPATINYSADFAKKISDASSVVITNLTSPLDRPETIRYAVSRVNNVYAGTGIEPSFHAPAKSGVSILVQDNVVLSDVIGESRVDLPMSTHIVIKVPYNELITDSVLLTLLSRIVGCCYDQSGASAAPRLSRLARGALLPTVMV